MRKFIQSAVVTGALLYAFTAEDSEKKKKKFKREKKGEERKGKKELGMRIMSASKARAKESSVVHH